MSEKQESSVLFSLKELMNLEEDRIKQEDQERQRQADEERRRAEVEAQRRRDEEEARLRGEEERRRLEEQRQREEATRLDAIRHAEIEARRIEAERAAQLEAMSKQQEHARQLAMIEQDEHKKKLRNMVIGISVGAVVLLGGGLGLYFGKIKPEAEAKQAALEQQKRQAEEEAAAAATKAEEAQAKVNELVGQLGKATSDKERLELQQKLADAQKDLEKAKGPRYGGPATGGGGGPKPATGGGSKCPPGDPLCGL